MLIGGVLKTTLLDYPEKVACIVFTQGCNFRCGFCHNPDLVNPDLIKQSVISEADFFSWLDTRRNILDGVVISGGEPLLQKDLPEFISKLKARGLLIKLDTNGTSPLQLQKLIDQKLIDYVAMDIKTVLPKYSELVKQNVDLELIKQSINILLHGKIDYEFRTTVIANYHTTADILEIAKLISGAPRYFLQKFVSSEKLLDPAFRQAKSLTISELETVAKQCQEYVRVCQVR